MELNRYLYFSFLISFAEVCTSMPLIVSKSTAGTVEKWHKVELACNTDGAMIVFTTDGSVPELHGATTKVSVCMSAVLSVCEGVMMSLVDFSVCFWITWCFKKYLSVLLLIGWSVLVCLLCFYVCLHEGAHIVYTMPLC